MSLITAALGCSSRSWRACYAEHKQAEQVLLHEELQNRSLQLKIEELMEKISSLLEERRKMFAALRQRRRRRDVGRVPQHHQHVETERQVGLELLRRLLPVRGSGIGYLQGIPAGFDTIKNQKNNMGKRLSTSVCCWTP